MALTYTIAGLQAELDAFETALKARSWATALDELNDYTLTYHGLLKSASADGLSIELPDPSALREVLTHTRELANKLTNNTRRVLTGRTNYGTPSG